MQDGLELGRRSESQMLGVGQAGRQFGGREFENPVLSHMHPNQKCRTPPKIAGLDVHFQTRDINR